VLQGAAEPPDELLAADGLAVRAPGGPAHEVAPGRLEQHRGEDRHGDGELDADARGDDAERRSDADVRPGDRDPHRHVQQRAAHRPVDVEQVGPDEPDGGRGRHGEQPGDHDRVRQAERQRPDLVRELRERRDQDREDAVHGPPDLTPLPCAKTAIAQAEDDRAGQRSERERGVEIRAQRPAEERKRPDVQRAGDRREGGGGRVRGLRIPREPPGGLHGRAGEQQRQRHRDGQPGDAAHQPAFVRPSVRPVGVRRQQREHRRAHPQPEALHGDVRRPEPPRAAELVEGLAERERCADPHRRGGAEDEQPAGRHLVRPRAERDHAAGVGREERRAPGEA
jgi:hypothetical protein